jgi:nicotinamide mononucleotide (NMN) deamidase PncC
MREKLRQEAESLLDLYRERGLTIATAESCTGGLLSAYLTAIAGASDVLERGFITYSNAAKAEMLSVEPRVIEARRDFSSDHGRRRTRRWDGGQAGWPGAFRRR